MDFDRIYRKLKDDVYSYVYWRVLDREEALDITQEIFMKVYRGMKGFEKRSSIKTWVFAIARNTVNNYFTRKHREYVDITELPVGVNMKGEMEKKIKVLRTLEQLVPEQKEVLKLYYFDGFSYKEIAELLGISIGTIKSRLHRAKESLKGKLEGLL